MKDGQEASFQRGSTDIDTPGEIEFKISEIEGNPAFRNTRDPQHKALVSKRMELIQKLSGSSRS
jgi:hypothetical protein